eukprot:Transcript_23428.p1 GENE.Transcript_23428~~Transcript_23428.p1  ORF type:complete len:322 (-),score=124.57 Transcript_23428:77-1042(-)
MLRRGFCLAARPTTLSAIVRAQSKADPTALALLAPQQDVAWDYGTLEERSLQLAKGLRELGYTQGSVAVSTVPNTVECLLLHLSLSHLGAALATVKDAEALGKLQGKANVLGAIVAEPGSWLATHELKLPPVIADNGEAGGRLIALDELLSAPADSAAEACTPESLLGSYGGAALTHAAAADLGEAAAARLEVAAADRACVSITLCHAFGMGSAVGSALRRGAAVVLPAVGGIRGCGDPAQRASVTLDVLEATGASVLFADSHTLKALPEREGGALPKLRTGVVKIGSGSDFLDVTHAVIGGAERPLEYAGTKLLAMGKRA